MANPRNRQGLITSILKKLEEANPNFVAGYQKSQEFGEGYAERTRRFNDAPYGRSMFDIGTDPDSTAGSVGLGYGGAFRKSNTPVVDPATGQPRIDAVTGKPVSPTGTSFGMGYTLGRVAADFGSNASLSKYWSWNHPLGVASDLARKTMRKSGETTGNRAMTSLGALVPAVAMGAAAGNVELSSLMEGDITGRAAGSQAVERKRTEEGTLDKDKQTETANALMEVAQRYILGRSGRIIDDYDLYVEDKLTHNELPVDEYTYKKSKSKQYESKGLHNAFGLVKFDGTNAINNEATMTQLGYSVPLSAATTFGGSMLGAGVAGRLMKDQRIPAVANRVKGSRGRGAAAAAVMGAAMGAGALLGKGAGVVANDALQGVINPRNKEFQDLMREELDRRNKQGQSFI